MFVFAWLAFFPDRLFSMVLVGLAIVLQFWLMLRLLNQSNYALSQFLRLQGHPDGLSGNYSQRQLMGLSGLSTALQSINDRMLEQKAEREKQTRFFQIILDQMNAGVMTVLANGKIEWYNRAAVQILGIDDPGKMEAIDRVHHGFSGHFANAPDGRASLLMLGKKGNMPVSARQKRIRLGSEELVLIGLYPVREELEHGESASWQKLIRVITHEMMNALTPMITLSNSLEKNLALLKNQGDAGDYLETLSRLGHAIRLIGERGEAMMDFVERFRSFTLLPPPQLKEVVVSEFIGDQLVLLAPGLHEKGIRIKTETNSPDLRMQFDERQISQVIHNLVSNAANALRGSDNPELHIQWGREDRGSFIRITDNGVGIPAENQALVFVPFFTTRKDGSGIGLSLSRQIMHLHQGSIELDSEPGKYTTICLWF